VDCVFPVSHGIKIESIGKLESKESSTIGESSKDSTEGSSQRNSSAWRLCMRQLGRVHVCKGRVRLPSPGSNTYLLAV
jgi:hypothetical protein